MAPWQRTLATAVLLQAGAKHPAAVHHCLRSDANIPIRKSPVCSVDSRDLNMAEVYPERFPDANTLQAGAPAAEGGIYILSAWTVAPYRWSPTRPPFFFLFFFSLWLPWSAIDLPSPHTAVFHGRFCKLFKTRWILLTRFYPELFTSSSISTRLRHRDTLPGFKKRLQWGIFIFSFLLNVEKPSV